MVFVDINVLLDVVQDDPIWAHWSQNNLDLLGATGELVINSIVHAELSVSYRNIGVLRVEVKQSAGPFPCGVRE